MDPFRSYQADASADAPADARLADARLADARLAGARAMADQFAGLLGTAEALARAGRVVDLRGLDDLGGRLCAASLDLPPAQGRALRGVLGALLARLDGVQAALAGVAAR